MTAALAPLRCDNTTCAAHTCLYGWHLPVKPDDVPEHSGWSDHPRRLALAAQKIVRIAAGEVRNSVVSDAVSLLDELRYSKPTRPDNDRDRACLVPAVQILELAVEEVVRAACGDHAWRTVAASDIELAAASALCGVDDDPYGLAGHRPRTSVDRRVAELVDNATITRMWDEYAGNLGERRGIVAAHRAVSVPAGEHLDGYPGATDAVADLVAAWDRRLGATLSEWEDRPAHLWVACGPDTGGNNSLGRALNEFHIGTLSIREGLYVVPAIVDAWVRRCRGGDAYARWVATGTVAELEGIGRTAATLVADGTAGDDAVEAALLLDT